MLWCLLQLVDTEIVGATTFLIGVSIAWGVAKGISHQLARAVDSIVTIALPRSVASRVQRALIQTYLTVVFESDIGVGVYTLVASIDAILDGHGRARSNLIARALISEGSITGAVVCIASRIDEVHRWVHQRAGICAD